MNYLFLLSFPIPFFPASYLKQSDNYDQSTHIFHSYRRFAIVFAISFEKYALKIF